MSLEDNTKKKKFRTAAVCLYQWKSREKFSWIEWKKVQTFSLNW